MKFSVVENDSISHHFVHQRIAAEESVVLIYWTVESRDLIVITWQALKFGCYNKWWHSSTVTASETLTPRFCHRFRTANSSSANCNFHSVFSCETVPRKHWNWNLTCTLPGAAGRRHTCGLTERNGLMSERYSRAASNFEIHSLSKPIPVHLMDLPETD